MASAIVPKGDAAVPSPAAPAFTKIPQLDEIALPGSGVQASDMPVDEELTVSPVVIEPPEPPEPVDELPLAPVEAESATPSSPQPEPAAASPNATMQRAHEPP